MALICRCLRSLGKLSPRLPILRPTLIHWAVGVSLLPSVAYCYNANNNTNDDIIPTMVIDCEDVTEIPPPETPVTLSEIQEMFLQTSNAAITLFQKTAAALVQAENEYAKIIYKLIAFYSASHKTLAAGDIEKEERISSLIIDTRIDIKEANEKRKKLMLVFASTEQLLKNLSEVAFMAGDEEASSFTYRVLWEVRNEVEDAAGESKNAESMLSRMQVDNIEVCAKYMEENSVKKEKEKQQEITG